MQDSPDLLALRALRDCRVVRATWNHQGYRLLRSRHLVTYRYVEDGLYDYRLTERGEKSTRFLKPWARP